MALDYTVFINSTLQLADTYDMIGGRPSFFNEIYDGDTVSVFIYDDGRLMKRRDYIALTTKEFEPLRAKYAKTYYIA